jgi:4-hydroxybenzoate polyprenyltransferase
VKNVLVYVPLITSHQLSDAALLIRGTYAFIAFSLCASSIYILNDLADIEADRQHPQKRFRPFASGALTPTFGAIAALVLLGISGAVALSLVGPSFLALLALYLGLTTAYTFYFKREPIADVIVLATLYVLRVVAGGVALDIALSNWLLAFALFLFLSLAFLKRYTEIKLSPNLPAINLVAGRGYRYSDADWLQAIGTTSGYLAVLVLALYVNSEDVTLLYSRPSLLLLLCPLFLYWISRTWFRAHRETLIDDPIVTALSDPASYLVAVAATAVLFAAL